ncbi:MULTISPECIES: CtsR family transcriptional regulator [Aneurinibacillus]|uniref:Transcriptional regulator CtsR n=1 Tax=Aneurinibacillus thermoaerophilus TaxID=143495 RepID=A0A1G8CTS2_ANETH|nr:MULTISPECIES: CtsR family transcriptional regulator [Aneurinibacillus]AMA74486.1 transcriptional regulator [Aneurinibacillus sp. XH2]MED0677309.1 CtsR family transcriptional regulator [Aneurinibacillus thermoaerophilus]MED0679073.1 CtsR family transcriptional regulator [Aneurinibacillus thermoaerophilus]MED0738742.1 CtsR family transcriptional regulator [Aneurinibacillus thermoaerophilus]MED0757843.1 CtsR family transcriptional regulator [Aneurinibacillus thermoaerophilus]
MRNISDIIEQHLKKILQQSNGAIEIQRSELADKFQCVPSQINYVISTRFTVEKGYIVESKRGGGGYIRIRKVEFIDNQRFYNVLMETIGESITATACENIIERLREERIILPKEMQMMKAATGKVLSAVPVPLRDRLRAEILRAMLTTIFIY